MCDVYWHSMEKRYWKRSAHNNGVFFFRLSLFCSREGSKRLHGDILSGICLYNGMLALLLIGEIGSIDHKMRSAGDGL